MFVRIHMRELQTHIRELFAGVTARYAMKYCYLVNLCILGQDSILVVFVSVAMSRTVRTGTTASV